VGGLIAKACSLTEAATSLHKPNCCNRPKAVILRDGNTRKPDIQRLS